MKCALNKILFLLIFLVPHLSMAQNPKKLIREGNRAYDDKKFDQSELKYRKSLEEDKNSSVGLFNLGDALYKQEKFEEAEDKFRQALTVEQGAEKKKVDESQIYHNLGNSLLKQEKFEESINAYKNALKRNPNDVDTKHNLSYAQRMLRQQQQNQQNQQNQDQKQDKDQKQNQQQQNDKQKEDQKQKDQQQQQQQQQNDEQNEQHKENKDGESLKPKNLTKEEAEKMLDALRNDERELQKKIKRAEPVRGTNEKNW